MSTEKRPSSAKRLKRYFLAGLLTVIPVWITVLVIKFVVEVLTGLGRPVVHWLAGLVEPAAPWLAEWLQLPWIKVILAVLVVLLAVLLLGWVATLLIGRKLIAMFDGLMNRIPLVKSIYGSVKQLITTFQQKPDGTQRVVLVDFPSPEMKTVGFVTRTLEDADTGRALAAVYVPTTPNPTSGYLEIVPLDKVTMTDWTMDEAMTFVVSAGAVAPPRMNYQHSAKLPTAAASDDATGDVQDAER